MEENNHRILQKLHKIKEELKQEKYNNILIDYNKLKEFQHTYMPSLDESIFAKEVLGINYSNYMMMKNSNKRARIKLEEYEVINEEIITNVRDSIKKEISTKEYIDYVRLQKLHQKYLPQINEEDFARIILGINYYNYMGIKNKNGSKSTRVFIDEYEKLIADKIVEIKELLKKEGYGNKKIDYSKLQELHKKYLPEISEREFSESVLGIKSSNYKAMKNRGTKAIILKKQYEILDDKRIEEVKELLLNEGYINKKIKYEELKILHKRFLPDVEEKEFAMKILGFSYSNYMTIKNKGSRGIIKNKDLVLIANYIRNKNIKDKRYYEESEIKNICEENDISLEDFIEYVILNKSRTKNMNMQIENYKTVIENKHRLWIGKTSMTGKFFENNVKEFRKFAQIIVNDYKYKYGNYKIEDDEYVQNLIIYVQEKVGDIEKNFGNDKLLLNNIVYAKMKLYFNTLLNNDYRQKETELIRNYKDLNREFNYISVSSEIDVNREVINEQVAENTIKRLKELVHKGVGKKEILQIVANEFQTEKLELISIISNYIKENGTIQIDFLKKNNEIDDR